MTCPAPTGCRDLCPDFGVRCPHTAPAPNARREAAVEAAGYLMRCLDTGTIPSGREFLALHDRAEWSAEEWAAMERESRRMGRAQR